MQQILAVLPHLQGLALGGVFFSLIAAVLYVGTTPTGGGSR